MIEKKSWKSKAIQILKHNLLSVCILLVVFSIVGVIAGNVIVKEGTVDVDKINVVDGNVTLGNGVSLAKFGRNNNSEWVWLNSSGNVIMYLDDNGDLNIAGTLS